MFDAVDFWSVAFSMQLRTVMCFRKSVWGTPLSFFPQKDTTVTTLQPAGLSSAFLTSSEWLVTLVKWQAKEKGSCFLDLFISFIHTS